MAEAGASPANKTTASKTITDTITGARASGAWARGPVRRASLGLITECSLLAPAGGHTHTIVGYSLIKGIGDGEPIASDRFTVGGHEWVSAGGLGAGGRALDRPPASQPASTGSGSRI